MDGTHAGEQSAVVSGTRTYAGGCHCGAIRFEVDLDLAEGASRCNCTICTKTGVTGRNVKPGAFRLVAGADARGTYVWGHEISKRYFCNRCGVQCYGEGHLAQIGGDFVSVNLNCLDDVDPAALSVIYWDGRHDNWQAGPRKQPWPMRSEG